MSDCNNCEFKCLCNSENNCIGWSGKSPLKKVCDASYQQGKEDVIEIIEEAKNECLHYFQDINFYYNDCRMKESLESFWNNVIEKVKGAEEMKFEFIEKEKPQKIWVNETEAHKYLDALIKANPICFREYIEKVKADAIDEFLELIEKRITESNHGLYLIDAMSFAEQLKEQ